MIFTNRKRRHRPLKNLNKKKLHYPDVHGLLLNPTWQQLRLLTFLNCTNSHFKMSFKKLVEQIFEFSKTSIYLALRFLPNFVMWWDWNRGLKSHVICHLSHFHCHMSLMPTATATDPTSANSSTMPIANRLLSKDQQI